MDWVLLAIGTVAVLSISFATAVVIRVRDRAVEGIVARIFGSPPQVSIASTGTERLLRKGEIDAEDWYEEAPGFRVRNRTGEHIGPLSMGLYAAARNGRQYLVRPISWHLTERKDKAHGRPVERELVIGVAPELMEGVYLKLARIQRGEEESRFRATLAMVPHGTLRTYFPLGIAEPVIPRKANFWLQFVVHENRLRRHLFWVSASKAKARRRRLLNPSTWLARIRLRQYTRDAA